MKRSLPVSDRPSDPSEPKRPNLVVPSETVRDLHDVNTTNFPKPSPEDLRAVSAGLSGFESRSRRDVSKKMRLVLNQIRALAADTRRDFVLGLAACNFVKRPGHVYHLYRRADGREYFGMLAPDEWDCRPSEFVASYRYEGDASFTPVRYIIPGNE